MTSEMIQELTVIKNTSEITSKQVLAWAKRVEAHRSWKALLVSIQENKEFDMIKHV